MATAVALFLMAMMAAPAVGALIALLRTDAQFRKDMGSE